MTDDDIARLVGKAGWTGIYTQWISPTEQTTMTVPVTPEQVRKFAELVAAEEREACAQWYAEVGWLMDEGDIPGEIRART